MAGALTAMGTKAIAGGGGGGGSHLDTQTMTTGTSGSLGGGTAQRGFIFGSLGSLTDATSNIYAGAAIEQMYWDQAADQCILKLNGVLANSGWTTLTGNSGVVLARGDAAFSTAGGKSTWTWNGVGSDGAAIFAGSPVVYFD